MDVAAVGHQLLLQHQDYRTRLSALSGLSVDDLQVWVPFLLALHDIGKFADSFQNLNPLLRQSLKGDRSSRAYVLRHDTLGWLAWIKSLKPTWVATGLIHAPLHPRRRRSELPVEPWIKAVVGHHGQPPGETVMEPPKDYFDESADYTAMSEFCKDLIPIMLSGESAFPEMSVSAARNSSWWLAGLAVYCDWLGSNTDYFSYQRPETSLKDYWSYARGRADNALLSTGMHQRKPSNSINLADLIELDTGDELKATPLQAAMGDWDLSDGQQLFILEDVTGAGKTEAAMLITHALMKSGQGDGMYFGLPTMATANGMYARMRKQYRKLFCEDAQPSLILAHGASKLSAEFRNSVLPSQNKNTEPYGDGTESAGGYCNAWLADNRKKALLADVGVGTIDQVLLSILPARHQVLRLLGLMGKILIVDEVHACDPYMHELLCALLQAHARSGGSAILLSATLPEAQRQALLEAYAKGRDWSVQRITHQQKAPYPLISNLSASGLREQEVETRSSVRRFVKVEMISDSVAIESVIEAAITEGRCVCWIRNTVVDAIESWEALKSAHPGWQIDLFHARFAHGDRLVIEELVRDDFGKKSTHESRKGRLVIATQVVEQSLDLDFDVLVTDLAPVDRVIQRAGRLCRHARDIYGNLASGQDQRGTPVLYVYSPVVTDNPDADWLASFFPKAQKVYAHHGQLWLTARVLQQQGGFQMPEDARHLIEDVYGNYAQSVIPDALVARSLEAEGTERAEASHAQWSILKMNEGYSSASAPAWKDESIAVTRLGEPTTQVYLARWHDDALVPWSDADEHAWELSAVSMRSFWINSECPADGISQSMLDRCKATLPAAGRWGVLLPLRESSSGEWTGTAMNQNVEAERFRYSATMGLERL